MKQIKVYITAKREHAERIKVYSPDGIHINARWLWMDNRGDRPVTHWLMENFDDAIASDFVIFYVEPGDHLKTSLIELGNALAHGKQIFIASDRAIETGDEISAYSPAKLPHKDLDPWVGFTGIKIIGTLAQTYTYIKKQVYGHEPITKAGKVKVQK